MTLKNLTIANGKETNGGGIYNDGGTVNLLNSTITGNLATAAGSSAGSAKGGGVYNKFGILNITNAVFSGNFARNTTNDAFNFVYPSDALGGAIFNGGGTVSITSSRFQGNIAQGNDGRTLTTSTGCSGFGGAIYNDSGLTVCLSTFLTNQALGGIGPDANSMFGSPTGGAGGTARGGAIYNLGTCWAHGNSFLGNGACGGRGGQGSYISNIGSNNGGKGGDGGETSGGGIYHGGSNLTLLACTLASNYVTGGAGCVGFDGLGAPRWPATGGAGGNGGGALGAGLYALTGWVSVTNSTFANNVGQGGNGGAGGAGSYEGAAGNGGIGGNAFGGIVVAGANVTCVNATFGWNRATGGAGGSGSTAGFNGTAAGGIGSLSGSVGLANSIVAYSTPTNTFRTVVDLGNNLSSDLSCCFTGTGSVNNVNPKLLALADNGGPNQTMALAAGSPAIDAGNDTVALGADQRGLPRPQGSHSDIGAYETITLVPHVIYGGLTLFCHGWPNTSNTLQAAASLPPTWGDMQTVVTGQDGVALFIVTTPESVTNKFFRVKLGQ